MARTRLLKPDFFTDEDLAELPYEARLLFAGLWTIADRDGRLEDRPKRIKAHLFPYDDVNVDYLLQRLASARFISRYVEDSIAVIQIRTFAKHQNPHHREPASVLPKNLSKNEKPRLGRGNASKRQGAASTQPQPGPAVFDTVIDTVSDPVRDTETVSDPVTRVAGDDGFERFWMAYPKKKAKPDALKAWRKLNPTPDLQQTILDAIEVQRQSDDWTRSGGQFIPYPASWLNGKRWLDEGVEVSALSDTARHNIAAAEESERIIRAWEAERDE